MKGSALVTASAVRSAFDEWIRIGDIAKESDLQIQHIEEVRDNLAGSLWAQLAHAIRRRMVR